MGVIKRQGIKGSMVQYVGTAMGILSTLFIYPLALEAYGFARFIMDMAMFWAPFIAFGAPALSLRYFPKFRNAENGHHGFLSFILLWGTIVALIFGGLTFFCWDAVVAFYEERSALIKSYLWVSPIIAVLIAFTSILQAYISNFKRIVVPLLLAQLIRFSLPAAILLFIYGYISNNGIIWIVLLNYSFFLLALLIYLAFLGEFKLKIKGDFYKKADLKTMGVYAMYGVFGSMGSILATRIDTIMVGTMVDLTGTGIYAVAMSLVNIIVIPFGAVIGITSPIISQAMKDGNITEVKEIYQKSSLNLLIVGLLVFLLIWLSLEDIFSIMKNTETLRTGKYVVFFLGIAKLIDLATSVNGQIIAFSKHFRVNFYTILCLAVFNVIFNITMIPIFGIAGAAIATLSSLTAFNLVKLAFIQYKFKIQPFSWNTLKLFLIAGIVYVLTWLIPHYGHPVLMILVRSILFASLYSTTILYLKISPDLNELVFGFYAKIRK